MSLLSKLVTAVTYEARHEEAEALRKKWEHYTGLYETGECLGPDYLNEEDWQYLRDNENAFEKEWKKFHKKWK